MARRNVILIGYMGAGKTSVGKRLANALGWRFLDMDEEIVALEGMPVTEIFRLYGEEAFRGMETRLLQQLLQKEDGFIISGGGGMPLRQENRLLLKELGTVVYLEVSVDTVMSRLQSDTTRPLLAGPHLEEKVIRMLKQRGPIYKEAADWVVDGNHKQVEEIVKEIRDRYENIGDKRAQH